MRGEGLSLQILFHFVKMLLDVGWHIEIATPLSLVIIFGVLVLSMLASVIVQRKK